ncbi:MAG: thiamine-binding protein [Bacteroidota bacterium]
MKCIIELSLYPLHAEYETIVLEFIEKLKSDDLSIEVNNMSTQVSGELHIAFPIVQSALEFVWQKFGQASLVIKAIKYPENPYLDEVAEK